MTTPHRLANVLTWALILFVLAWLCLIAIPQFVDRCSRHEDAWQGMRDLPSVKLSKGD